MIIRNINESNPKQPTALPSIRSEPPPEQTKTEAIPRKLINAIIPQQESNSDRSIEATPLPNDMSILEREEENLERLMKKAHSLNKKKATETQEMINKLAESTVEKILEGNDPSLQEKPVEIKSELVSLLEKDELFEPEIEKTDIEEIDMMTPGSIAIVSLMLLSRMKQIINLKKERLSTMDPKDPALENEISLLEKWVGVQSDSTTGNLKKLGFKSLFSSPNAITILLNLTNVSSSVLTSILGWVGIGFGVISQVRDLKKKRDEFHEHEKWAGSIQNSGSIQGVIGEGEEVKPVYNELRKIWELGIVGEEALAVYNEQKRIFEEREKSNLAELKNLLDPLILKLKEGETSLIDEQNQLLLEVESKLKEAGIKIPEDEKKTTIEDMRNYLSDEANHLNFNKMMVQKKETLSVYLRNGLRILANNKEQIDRGFLKLALNKSKIGFTTTLVFTALTIALKVLVAVGTVAASTALAATGFGALALGVGFTVIGAVYLYLKKPNIFMTYLKGVQLQLLFWRIPMMIRSYQRHFTLLKTNKISEEVQLIGSKILEIEKQLGDSESSKKTLAKLKQNKIAKEMEIGLQEKKLKALNESFEHFSKKVKVLQEKIDEAGWKDFVRLLNKQKNSATSDATEILAEHLLMDATLLEDSQTKKVLDHMDLDIKKLKGQDLVLVKNETAKALRGFFAMEEGATLHMIKKQRMMTAHGL